MTDLVVGIDIGSTETKVIVTTPSGDVLAHAHGPTRWTSRHGQRTETDADVVVGDAIALIARVVDGITGSSWPNATRVIAVGITGMGECGVLVDGDGAATHPMIAWHDARGEAEIRQLGDTITEEFRGRTGLPLSALPTVAKLAWLSRNGTPVTDRTWLGLPEYLAFRLGAVPAAELSLVSRTGLFDQESQKPWLDVLDRLGAGPCLLPPIVRAGTPLGQVRDVGVPAALQGAAITVAGHDHCVAAVGAGAIGPGTAFHSVGTAQVIVRPVEGATSFASRERLAAHGIDTVTHVLGSRPVLIAGTRTGLLMRKALSLLGAQADPRRSDLDKAALPLAEADLLDGVHVSGARDDDGCLRLTVASDDISPAVLWAAVLLHDRDEIARLLRLMADEVGDFTKTVVSGGWTRMSSVRAAKSRALPAVTFSGREDVGAFGAALFGSFAAELSEHVQQPQWGLGSWRPFDPAPQLLPSPSDDFVRVFTATSPIPAQPTLFPSRSPL